MQMDMSDLESEDHETDLFGLIGFIEGSTDRVGHACEMFHDVGFEVGPRIDLGTRDDERMAGFERRNRQERDADVVLPDEMTRQFAVDAATRGPTRRAMAFCNTGGIINPTRVSFNPVR